MNTVNISRLVSHFDPKLYSASQSELGENAGSITWENSIDAANSIHWNKNHIPEIKRFLSGLGGWDEREIKRMSHIHLKALMLQFVSGFWREAFNDIKNPLESEWKEYYSNDNLCLYFSRTESGETYFNF